MSIEDRRACRAWSALVFPLAVAVASPAKAEPGAAGDERLNALVESFVFDSNRDGNFEIFVMNADGSDQTQLTSTGPEAENSGASWRQR